MKIGLFIPCYVDAVFPEVGVATYRLLRHLGYDVRYPEGQTCCGQPMANAGFEGESVALGERFEDKFAEFDYVVAPSVSCTAFIKLNYPRLLKGKHECSAAKKTIDVVEFLHDIAKVDRPLGRFPYKVSLHNSCHGVVEGIEVVEPDRPDECCGFGGMFSVEETGVSTKMGQQKLMRHMATGARYITGPDCSCLMHMAGIAAKQGCPIEFKHVVEILAAGL